ncbi:MAG: hypothetical protein WKF89_16510 [Chitinophagaceae bacterium]
MTNNLVESIQKNLGFAELHKIDPNTQAVKESGSSQEKKDIGQAAIPAVLMGLYTYGNTEFGSEEIIRGNSSTNWLDTFFGDKKDDAISKVTAYSGTTKEEAGQKMEQIANEAVRLIRESTPDSAKFSDVKAYVAQQRANILVYLPAELQMSEIVNDNTLDDRTNKMEGPMSNSMHFIEKLFSGSTTEKYDRTKEDEEKRT